MVEEGGKAPDFALLDDQGNSLKLSDFRGKKSVVLFFYPKANTPGWTREASEFRDAKAKIDKKGAVAIGISPDSVEKQTKFRDKHTLNMPLLADTEKQVAADYGVYKKKSLYGRIGMGVERTTFIIGKDGRIIRIFPKVKVAGHADAVIQALDSMESWSK